MLKLHLTRVLSQSERVISLGDGVAEVCTKTEMKTQDSWLNATLDERHSIIFMKISRIDVNEQYVSACQTIRRTTERLRRPPFPPCVIM